MHDGMKMHTWVGAKRTSLPRNKKAVTKKINSTGASHVIPQGRIGLTLRRLPVVSRTRLQNKLHRHAWMRHRPTSIYRDTSLDIWQHNKRITKTCDQPKGFMSEELPTNGEHSNPCTSQELSIIFRLMSIEPRSFLGASQRTHK